MENEYAASTLESLKQIQSLSEEENRQIFLDFYDQFENFYLSGQVPFFSAEPDRIWQLFLERYNLLSGQLRVNMIDLRECFDLAVLSQITGRDELFLRRMPPSSEIVITTTQGGIRVEFYIPPRLLILDMLLMLEHARQEHKQLESHAAAQRSKPMVEIIRNGRLDTYSRQVLIIATTIIDNVLNEYGFIVEGWLSNKGDEQKSSMMKSEHRKGVTYRLENVLDEWALIFGTDFSSDADYLEDMIYLVQIRNRLVHPDGRVNCWHALQVSPVTGDTWHFSTRIESYLHQASYEFPGTHIGNEFALARFCVDTLITTIHHIHSLLYPDDGGARWLDFDLLESGGLDFDAIRLKEPVFRQP